MPFSSTAQQRYAFGTHQPWAKRWAKETDFSKIPKRVRKKMAAAGVPLHGPGGLLGTPGMGGRKWGNRRKDGGCTCGENVATKEQLAPGVTRIRGNLCNVHGRYGPCDGGSGGSKKPKGGKGGGKGRKLAKPKQTPGQRAQAREAQHATNRAAVDKQLGIAEDTAGALDDLRAGKATDDDGGLVKMGLAEQAADGSYRLTPAGRALVAARNAGDAGRARDIISGAKDRTLARNARETAAEMRREAADKRKRDAEAKRAAAAKKKPKAGGGGGKGKKGGGDTSGADTRAQREQERQADRARRQQEHEQDRAQRQREHAEDRAQRQRERSEDRAQRLEERRQRSGGRTPVPTSHTPIVLRGTPNRGTTPRKRTTGGSKVGDRRQTTKAQSAQDRAMFARMGKGGGGGKKGGGGGGAQLWARNPDTGKREPNADQRDAQKQREVRRLVVPDKQRDTFARRAGDKAEHEIRQRYRVESLGDGEYTLRDYNRATSSYRGVSVASGNRDKVDRALNTKVRTARTRAENDAKQSVDFYNSDVRRGMYPNPSSAKRDREKFKSLTIFTVFKDDTDAYRWLARTTTAYRDRDGEIITTKALEDDAARMTATKQYGPLRYWHIGQPDPFNPSEPWGVGLDIGECDYSVVIGRTSIESGTFKSAAIGKAFAESAGDYELSPGFFHPPNQPNRAGEYDTIRRFERSVVPIKYGRASNLFTGMTVKGERMDQSTYDARVKAFLEDMNKKGVPEHAAAAALAGMQQADKSAAAQGIAYKSDDAPQVFTAPDGTQGIIQDGRFVALKAAAPEMDAKADEETVIEDMAEGGVEEPGEMDGGDGEYIGDMTPAEFWDQLKSYLADILAPQAKMEELAKSFASGLGEMKALYSTKDTGTLARISALEAELATLKGDAPAVVLPADIDAALKSGGPQAPPDPNAPQVPDDPSRPLAALAARTMPALYSTNPNGQWAGWTPTTMPPSQS